MPNRSYDPGRTKVRHENSVGNNANRVYYIPSLWYMNTPGRKGYSETVQQIIILNVFSFYPAITCAA